MLRGLKPRSSNPDSSKQELPSVFSHRGTFISLLWQPTGLNYSRTDFSYSRRQVLDQLADDFIQILVMSVLLLEIIVRGSRCLSCITIDIDGIKIVIKDAIGSTGLDLKMDPGLPIVYAGFGALMLTTCISYLSHSQIWALQDGTSVVVGGKTNRAKLEFPDEMNKLLNKVSELVSADEKVNND